MNEIVILLGADVDLVEHFGRFEDTAPGRGFEFDESFVKACDLLKKHPQIAARCGGSFRRLLMLEWNLGVFYKIVGQRILIHAIMDLRQNPSSIKRRLGLR